jgi:hypothetical protein
VVSPVVLEWRRYGRMTDARRDFGAASCVYVQADASGRPVRVGMASQGLHARYRGGTGWALDAAMHHSGNLVFVAAVPSRLVAAVEAALIWEYRDLLVYNNLGKRVAPPAVAIEHAGYGPAWT